MKNNHPLKPLPEEVLKNILEFCLEDGRDGSYIPQRTLASALRVNTTFYLLAGPILYHSPTVMDINSFFLGSDKQSLHVDPSSQHDSDSLALQSIKSGNTKSPLLKHGIRFRFLPRSIPVEGVDVEERSSLAYWNQLKSDPRYFSHRSGDTYAEGFELVSKLRNDKREIEKQGKKTMLMPRLRGLSIGSDLLIDDSDERIGEIAGMLYENWVVAISYLRHYLWEILNRNELEWCEWQEGDLSLMEFQDPEYVGKTRIIPRVFNLHTELLHNIPLQWGCTNRVIIRRKDDEDYWSRQKLRTLGKRIPPLSDLDDDTPEPDSYAGEGLLPQDEHTTMEQYEIISLLLTSICDSHPSNRGEKISTEILQNEIEDKTVFEIYGFEGISLPEDGNYDCHWTARGSNEWDRDDDVDMGYIEKELRNAEFPAAQSGLRAHPSGEVDPMQAVLITNPHINLDSDEDEDEDEDEDFEPQAVPPPGYPPTSPENHAKLKLWLASFDYQLIKSLHDEFEDTRGRWTNGDGWSGPKIRFLPFRVLPRCQGCGLSGKGWVDD